MSMGVGAAWRQAALITLGAGAVLAAWHLLPAGSSLTPMDFLADEHAVLQFCDPLNSRPLPVVAGRPPVTLAATGQGVFTLTTISGKPIGPADLLPRGHPDLRLTITDPAGASVRVANVAPGRIPGLWAADFAPQQGGIYRMTAAFTPIATEKETTAAANFQAGTGGAPAR
jgi:hypothetical protein